MSGMLRITLTRGLSGRNGYTRSVVRGLGLTRLHRPVILKDTPEIRGMIAKVKFLLKVEETGDAK